MNHEWVSMRTMPASATLEASRVTKLPSAAAATLRATASAEPWTRRARAVGGADFTPSTPSAEGSWTISSTIASR